MAYPELSCHLRLNKHIVSKDPEVHEVTHAEIVTVKPPMLQVLEYPGIGCGMLTAPPEAATTQEKNMYHVKFALNALSVPPRGTAPPAMTPAQYLSHLCRVFRRIPQQLCS